MSVGVARVTNGIKSIEPESAGHTAERPLDGSLKVCPPQNLPRYPQHSTLNAGLLKIAGLLKLLDCSKLLDGAIAPHTLNTASADKWARQPTGLS